MPGVEKPALRSLWQTLLGRNEIFSDRLILLVKLNYKFTKITIIYGQCFVTGYVYVLRYSWILKGIITYSEIRMLLIWKVQSNLIGLNSKLLKFLYSTNNYAKATLMWNFTKVILLVLCIGLYLISPIVILNGKHN